MKDPPSKGSSIAVAILVPLSAVAVAALLKIFVERDSFPKETEAIRAYAFEHHFKPLWIDLLVAMAVLWVGTFATSNVSSQKFKGTLGLMFLGLAVCTGCAMLLPFLHVTNGLLTVWIPLLTPLILIVVLSIWLKSIDPNV